MVWTAALIILAGCLGCGASGDGDGAGHPFRFIVMTDTHVRIPGNPDDDFYFNQQNLNNIESAVDRINAQYASVDFVAVTGDLVGCLFSENPDDYLTGTPNPAEKFKQIMNQLTMPYYVTLGNHDYQNDFDTEAGEGVSSENIEAIESVWSRVLEISPYHSFVHKGVHFIFLNSNRGPLRERVCLGAQNEKFCTGSFDEAQLDWLETRLEAPEPAVLFCHHPPITDSPDTLWTFLPTYRIDPEDNFYNVVERNREKIIAMFVGHGHLWQYDTLHGTIDVYETAPIGDRSGSPDHISIVDIDPAAHHVTVTRGDG